MERHLLIDDMRNIFADDIARTYQEGIAFLRKTKYTHLWLDHDLGEGKTGYDVMCWLEQNQQHLPDKIICISANPVGNKRINVVIKKLKRE
jgi:hypothetical protein